MRKQLKERVLEVIENSEEPLSTEEIARKLREPVEKVYEACLELEKEGELEDVSGREKGSTEQA